MKMPRASLAPRLSENSLSYRDTLRKAARMAIPSFMASFLVFAMNFLNFIVMATFSTYESVAAYGIVAAYINFVAVLIMPIASGVVQLLEEAEKAKEFYRIQTIISSATIAAVVIGVVSALFGFFIAPAYAWQVLTPEAIKPAVIGFMRIFAFSFIPMLYFSITTNILIQQGEQRGPILAQISALALHAGFSYIFVGLFGWDIQGIAISAIVAQTTAGVINTHLILTVRRNVGVENAAIFDWSVIRTIFRNERTVEFTAMLGGVFAIFLQFYIDQLGIPTIAAFSLFFILQDFLLLPIRAFQSPIRRLSAKSYEAGGNVALIRAVNPILIALTIYTITLIPYMHLTGNFWFGILGHNPEVTTIATRLGNLVSYFYVFYVFSLLLTASLEGLGHKAMTMNLNILFNYIIRFVVLVLSAELIQGAESIIICYPVSWAIGAAALMVYYVATYPKRTNKYSI